MDWLLTFFSQYGVPLGGAAAALAIIETVFKPFRKLFGGTQTVKLDEETKSALAPLKAADRPALTVPEFIRLRRELKADLEEELTAAQDAEKDQLRARIAELEKQISHPEEGLAELQKRNAELEALLERSGNEIGGDRLSEARAALEKGDYSVADDLFAEIEERRNLEIQEAARAAFGRGEIAEAEVRWADAAAHYVRAANLNMTFDTLFKAREFTWRAGELDLAFHYGQKLLNVARAELVQENLASALNEHAITLRARGKNDEAEELMREALEIAKSTFGEFHPDYANCLNNLALSLGKRGQDSEAEKLFREALKIDEATIGRSHPHYAIRITNLASLLLEQERYEEAERAYREALEIGEATIGSAHPDYATRFNNLALVVAAQGRNGEAEELYREAIEIDRKALGVEHPSYAIDLNNLAQLIEATGRNEEAEALYREALEILKKTLGFDHPNTMTARKNLEHFLSRKHD